MMFGGLRLTANDVRWSVMNLSVIMRPGKLFLEWLSRYTLLMHAAAMKSPHLCGWANVKV